MEMLCTDKARGLLFPHWAQINYGKKEQKPRWILAIGQNEKTAQFAKNETLTQKSRFWGDVRPRGLLFPHWVKINHGKEEKKPR
jgi:hypothetical protein